MKNVMSDEEIKLAYCKAENITVNPANLRISPMTRAGVEAQAEVSFKLGIREVVEFMRTDPYADEWQVQLKAWGIKEIDND